MTSGSSRRVAQATRQGRGSRFRETRRTPGPAVGCNKPTVLRAEEAVEVVRNHEDGTGAGRVVPSARRESRGNSGLLGVDAQRMCRWRGNEVTNPKRGWVPIEDGASAPDRPRGARPMCGRFEGDGRSGVPTKGGLPPGSELPVTSSRAPGW